MDTRPGTPVNHPSGADVPAVGGEAEYFARAAKPRRGPAPRPKPALPIPGRPVMRGKAARKGMSATGRDLHVDNFMKPRRRGAVTGKGGGMSASIKGAMARNAAAAEAMARAHGAIKTTGSYRGKSNALGHGGRAAQLKARGVPGGVIGALARKAGAAPGMAHYHGGKGK